MDDVLAYIRILERLYELLTEVYIWLGNCGLTINVEKPNFGVQEVFRTSCC